MELHNSLSLGHLQASLLGSHLIADFKTIVFTLTAFLKGLQE